MQTLRRGDIPNAEARNLKLEWTNTEVSNFAVDKLTKPSHEVEHHRLLFDVYVDIQIFSVFQVKYWKMFKNSAVF